MPKPAPDDQGFVEIPIDFTAPEHTEVLPLEPVSDSSTCQHYFVRKTATEVECSHCGWGLFVNPADQLVDGQLAWPKSP